MNGSNCLDQYDYHYPDKEEKKWKKLIRLEQTGMVREFAEKFEEIYDSLEVKPDNGGVFKFFNGLNETMKNRLNDLNLEEIKHFKILLKLALKAEDEILGQSRPLCFICNKPGHLQKNCWNNKKRGNAGY